MKPKNLTIIFFSILVLGCAKNKPEKFILGKWEVINVDGRQVKDNNPQIFKDFKNDLSYFEHITFYEDSLVYIDYLNTKPTLGTYYIVESAFFQDREAIYTSHFPLKDSTQVQKFNFQMARFDIKEFSRNKLLVTTDWLAGNETFYKKISIQFKKVGQFE